MDKETNFHSLIDLKTRSENLYLRGLERHLLNCIKYRAIFFSILIYLLYKSKIKIYIYECLD